LRGLRNAKREGRDKPTRGITMATSTSVPLSGIQDIDALLEGSKWNTGNLTFSFPTSVSVFPTSSSSDPFLSGFQVVVPALEGRVRAAPATFSEYANMSGGLF
jgi:hypothetical protein